MWTLLQLSMVFVTTMYKTATAQTELDCGETLFTNSSGAISLPTKSRNFLATVNCTYTVSLDETSTILLSVIFRKSTPLSQSFKDCSKENIMVGCVSEGETEPNPSTTRVFCNLERDLSDLSHGQLSFADCRTLKLSVRSMNYDNRETINIPYLAVGPKEECGNTSFSAPSGRIIWSRLPKPFLKPVNCLYTIDGGHAKSVVLSLHYVHPGTFFAQFGPKPYCEDNWLTITCLVNGTSMAHPNADRRLCRVLIDFVARFPDCDTVQINYVYDGIDYASFGLDYRMGDYDEACGNTSFNGPNGIITSPRFPLSYPHNLDCMYSIVGGPKNVISLSFLEFHLQGEFGDCSHDKLTITCFSDDYLANVYPKEHSYCGNKVAPLTITLSDCSVVVLKFVTDSSINHGGFRLRYTVEENLMGSLCGVRLHDRPFGAIDIRNLDCTYTINTTEPSSISLTIRPIRLHSLVGDNCLSDYLEITCIDGQTALNHQVRLRSCDSLNTSTQMTFAKCAAVELIFHKGDTATGKAFLIDYTITGDGDLDINTQKSGHSVVISVTVVLLVVVAVVLAVLWYCRRHRAKNRSEILLEVKEEGGAQLEFENAIAEGGMSYAALHNK